MKLTYYFYLLFAVVLAICGCAPARSTLVPRPTTPLPSLTPIPSPTLKHTSQLTQSATPMPPLTLEPKQAEDTIRALLQEPVDCDAPCFWGIAPEQTTLSEAGNIFRHLGIRLKYVSTRDQKTFYDASYDFSSGLLVSANLAVYSNLVQSLTIYITPEVQQAESRREWLAYSPETLINRYGLPSRIDFYLDWGPRSFFDMVIYFDSVNLIVEYTAYDVTPRKKGPAQVCPLNTQFDSVRLWMGKNPIRPPGEGGVSLEDATSMTLEEFSKLMTGEPDNACFTVNGDVFP